MPERASRPTYSQEAARSLHCWLDVDRVPGDEATTAWKRRARWRQTLWREARDIPIGFEPYNGGPNDTRVGSRIELHRARESGANFLTPSALEAVRHRLKNPEPYQMIREDRLWADLLSSMPLCFNLFGPLWANEEAARSAVRAWWPSAPAGPWRVRFEHSPGRRDPCFLGNQSAFDVAFLIEREAAGQAVIGVETKYHEHATREDRPEAEALQRYSEVTGRSGAFVAGWENLVVGTDLQQIWLDHLLVLSMLQHPEGRWTWGKFVLVYPQDNPSFVSAAGRYPKVLRDPSTFEAKTLEELVTDTVLGQEAAASFRNRYLRDWDASEPLSDR